MLHWLFGGKRSPEHRADVSGGAEEPGSPRRPQAGMLLRLTKEPNGRFVEERRFVDWVSAEGHGDGGRIPHPCTREYPLPGTFRIGEMEYHAVSELRVKELDREKQIYQDRYGRVFAEIRERFPCFDSFDYASENRYYHWLYLTENGKLFLVYYEDGGKKLTVTEDAGEITARVWREMVSLGWVEEREVQTLAALPV